MNEVDIVNEGINQEYKCYGAPENNLESQTIWAGQITIQYQNGNLRYIRIGKTEIIRMIYPAVRDNAWLTVPPVIVDERRNIQADSFEIEYSCRYQQDEIDFIAYYSIRGRKNNSLTFEMNGVALSSFLKNRIGFCILHPVEGIAGNSCSIIHSNGKEQIMTFPETICPHQPFKDISAMKWKSTEGIQAELRFSGDIFETEDQRNWTDASYKTYCTPLDQPYPVLIQKGHEIYQKVELLISNSFDEVEVPDQEIKFSVYPERLHKLPKFGIGRSSRKEPIQSSEISQIRKLPFDHYRVDLYLFEESWRQVASLAWQEASHLGCALELALFFDERAVYQATSFVDWAFMEKPELDQMALFSKSISATPDTLINEVIFPLRKAFPGVPIGAGTNANFAQLNRSRLNMVLPDFITFSVHPQEHAFDNESLTENLQAQKYAVDSARQFSKGKGIRISPVNIRRRFNANLENFEHPSKDGVFPPQIDSRQMSLFGAAWTLGSIKYLSESDVEAITYFETVGERGIVQGAFATKWPERFHAVPGMVFPVFFIFEFLLKRKHFAVLESKSSDPLSSEILFLSNGDSKGSVITNFKDTELSVSFKGIAGKAFCRVLDAGTYNQASCKEDWYEAITPAVISLEESIKLMPFSVTFLELF